MKIYHQEKNSYSIKNYNNKYGPLFGKICDLGISDPENSIEPSFSTLLGSYGKSEGANERDLTKNYRF
jgi:hypothetical protein